MTYPPFPPAPPTAPNIFFQVQLVRTIVIDYNADNAVIGNSAVALTFNAKGGSRWQSVSYTSGFFQTSLQCPQGATSGLLTSYYLNSKGVGPQAQGIGFDFPGNEPSTAYATLTVNGGAKTTAIRLGYDCSAAAHLYSIYWDENYIAWYVDQVMVRAEINTLSSQYVSLPLYLFGSITDASAVNGGTYAGVYTGGAASSFTAYFDSLSAVSPIRSGSTSPPPPAVTLPANPPPLGGEVLAPVLPNYCSDHCLGCTPDNADGDIDIVFDRYCGSRFQSLVKYPSAVVSLDWKCPDNDTSGMITAVYMSTQEGAGSQDEIDWEFIGSDKAIMQTNFYVRGIGGNEIWHDLGFDCSTSFHNYALEWTQYNIIWYIDYKPIRIVINTQEYTGAPYPTRPMYVYGSLWDASWVCGGCWTGKRANYTLDPNFSFVAKFRNMKVLSPI